MKLDYNIIPLATICISWGTTIGYIKTKLDNLTEKVDKQNGRINRLEGNEYDHLKEYHTK